MNLSGSICALATPFRSRNPAAGFDGSDADSLDLDAWVRLLDYQISSGTRALVVAGSTGEAAALDEGEFSELLGRAVEHVAGRVPVLAGTGQQSTRKTIAQTLRARDAGAGAALVAAPAYVRPTQEGLYRHFCAVADHGGLPIVLYNVPSRTACDLLPETAARLAGHGGIVGIKEARNDPERMRALLGLRSDGFRILSGDDPTCVRAILAGADGVVSVAANVVPGLFARLGELAAAGRQEAALQLDERLHPLYALLGIEPNPIPVKWCLSRMGLGEPALRLPLLPLSMTHHAHAGEVLAALGLIEAVRATG